MNQVQKSLSKQSGAWLFKTLSRMIIVITWRNTKEVQNIVMNRNWKSHHEHRDGSKIIKKSRRESRDGSKFEKVVPKIAMDKQDSGRRQSSRHTRIRVERLEGSKVGKIQFVMSSLMDQKLEDGKIERIHDERVDGS